MTIFTVGESGKAKDSASKCKKPDYEMSETASVTIAATKSKSIGRVLRFMLGGFMLATTVPQITAASWTSIAMVAGTIVALLVGYIVIHLAVWRFVPRLNRWLGALVAVTPAALVFELGGGIGQASVIVYIGGSLLIDSFNGDAGCEVMALPGILTGKRTHLACLVFSPLDWVEEKIFA